MVIPTRNAAKTLDRCLTSLANQSQPPETIVVVDGGSTDGTQELALRHDVHLVSSVANRSIQRNVGAEYAPSAYLLFVDADMALSYTVVEECLSALTTGTVALVIPEVSVGTTFWARVRTFERSFYQGVWWLEAARCVRKDAFVRIGGYDPRLIGGEDYDLDERLRAIGEVGRIVSPIYHDEGEATLVSRYTKTAHYAGSHDLFMKLHPDRARMQLSLWMRVGVILRTPGRIVQHPALVAGLVVMKVVERAAVVRRGQLPVDGVERRVQH